MGTVFTLVWERALSSLDIKASRLLKNLLAVQILVALFFSINAGIMLPLLLLLHASFLLSGEIDLPLIQSGETAKQERNLLCHTAVKIDSVILNLEQVNMEGLVHIEKIETISEYNYRFSIQVNLSDTDTYTAEVVGDFIMRVEIVSDLPSVRQKLSNVETDGHSKSALSRLDITDWADTDRYLLVTVSQACMGSSFHVKKLE